MNIEFAPLALDAAKTKEAMGEAKATLRLTPEMCTESRNVFNAEINIDMAATDGLHIILGKEWLEVAQNTGGEFTIAPTVNHKTTDEEAYSLQSYTISVDAAELYATLEEDGNIEEDPSVNVTVRGTSLYLNGSYNLLTAPRVGRALGEFGVVEGGFMDLDAPIPLPVEV